MLSTMEFHCAAAVVTGAGNGIGRSIAVSLARRGVHLLLCDIDAQAAEGAAAEIQAGGGTAVGTATDVSDRGAVEALAELAYSTFGKVDILCNNAGVSMRPYRAVWDSSPADFRWMMDVNYFGVVNGILAFVPRMLEQQGRRHMVNTSSIAGLVETPGHGAYAASKAAVDAVSDALRVELFDSGIDFGVTVLHPGMVATNISKTGENHRNPADRSSARDVRPYPYPRLGAPYAQPIQPSQVGDMVVNAIADGAPYRITHPAPVDEMRSRVERIASSYSSPASAPE